MSLILSFLQIPSEFLQWPNILVYLIIPISLFWYGVKSLLMKIKIFRSSFVNSALAAIVALSSLYIIYFSFILVPIAIIMIGVSRFRGKLRILIICGSILLYFILTPLIEWLTRFLV